MKRKYRVIYNYKDIYPDPTYYQKNKVKIQSYSRKYYAKHKERISERYKVWYGLNATKISLRRKELNIIRKHKILLKKEMKRLEREHFLKKKYFRKWFLLTFKITIKERNKKVRKYNKWLKELLTLHFD